MEPMALLSSSLVLFAIVNPIGSLPIFLQLTAGMERRQRNRVFDIGCLVAAVILSIFIFIGNTMITEFFQISMGDLMAAGGLLLLIIALDHLIFGFLSRSVLSAGKLEARQLGAVPIACPILAGPGAMMSVLLTYSDHGLATALLSVLIVLGVTWMIMRSVDFLFRILGQTTCTVLSKILCLFIAAMGMSLLIKGIKTHF
jgi:multiple antibiotic resistance protein